MVPVADLVVAVDLEEEVATRRVLHLGIKFGHHR